MITILFTFYIAYLMIILLINTCNLLSFIFKINNHPQWARFRNNNCFVSKLPYTTASYHRKTVKPSKNGKAGIMKSLREFMNNPRIFGYIDEAIIQPLAHYNAEASIFVFGGKAALRNPHKVGTGKKSVFDHSPGKVFDDFAEEVVRKLREICPELIANQVLRVDFFGDISETGELVFIVNEVEGYEARQWGVGVNAISKVGELRALEKAHWKFEINTLIECHLELQKSRK